MSFSASAQRALDSSQPFGRRVTCLHECLERFSLFGFSSTRDRLRVMYGASGPGWTEPQLVGALTALAEARQSWARFADAELARQRAAKHAHRNGGRPSQAQMRVRWLESYLTGKVAEAWHVAQLGDCSQCGHQMIHHDSFCRACFADPQISWESRCRQPLPDAIAISKENSRG